MALIKCYECGNQVSTEASACPHCGAPKRTSPPLIPSAVNARHQPPELPKKKSVGVLNGCLIIFLAIFIVGTLITGIMQSSMNTSSSTTPVTPSPTQSPPPPQAPPSPSLTSVEEDLLCRGAVAVLFGKPIDIIQVTKRDGDVIYLSYVRESDGTTWKNKCRIQGESIMWGSEDGRWRSHQDDEKITFSINRPEKIFTIKLSYSDGSGETKSFSLQ